MSSESHTGDGQYQWPSQKRLLTISWLIMAVLSLINLYSIYVDEQRYLLTQAENSTRDHARQVTAILQAYSAVQCDDTPQTGLLPDDPTPAALLIETAANAVFLDRYGAIYHHRGDFMPDILSFEQVQRELGLIAPGMSSPVIVGDATYMVSHCVSGESNWAISQVPNSILQDALLETAQPAMVFALEDSMGQRLLPKIRGHAELARLSIPNSSWQLLACEVEGYIAGQIAERLMSPLILILVMSLVVLTSIRLQKQTEQTARQAEIARLHAEARADLVLQSIEDALVSTDSKGNITYYNPRAATLFGMDSATPSTMPSTAPSAGHSSTSPSPVTDPGSTAAAAYLNGSDGRWLNQPLEQVWPHPRALWTHGLSIRELEALQDQGRTLSVVVGEEARVLEQNYHPLYRDNQIDGIVWILRDISTSVRTRQELERSRQRYMSLFEEAGVAHWVLDLSGFSNSLDSIALANANNAAVELAGAGSKPQMQLQFAELFQLGCDKLIECLQQMQQSPHRIVEAELQLKRLDGPVRVLSAHFSSGIDQQVMVSLIDITEKKRANELTREQEAFWGAVMAAMPDTVRVANLDDELLPSIVYSNRSAAETLGYLPDSSVDAYDWPQYCATPECKQGMQETLRQLRNCGSNEPLLFRGKFLDANGTHRVIQLEYTPFRRDIEGQVDRYICTSRDITEEVTKQQQIVDSEARYRLVAENMTDIVWSTDTHLNFTFVSASIERLLGYTSADLFELGIGTIFDKRDIRRLFKEFRSRLRVVLKAGEEEHHKVLIQRDITARARNGERYILELQATLLWNSNGVMEGILGVCRDVTEARQNQRELMLASDVFENSNEAILVTDDKFRIVKTNRAFSLITGFDSSEVLGKTPETLLGPEHNNHDFLSEMMESLLHDSYWQGELKFLCQNGAVRTSWTGVSIIRDGENNIQSLTIIMSDITDRKVIEERIHKLAYFDPLTGLANRTQMHERLDLMMHRGDGKNRTALLFIDLDRFKPINDSFGHPAGDKILVQVAGRLRNCVKSTDIVSRMGGDEFTICLNFSAGDDDIATLCQQVAERILKEVNKPYYIDKHQLFLSASVGIAIYPNDALTVIELLKNADMAMYHAKESGRNNLQFFNADMNRRAVERMQLENDLHQVIQRNELYMMFQPQFDSRSLRPVGVETLLRWHHPDRGDIPPQLFVDILEDTGLIVPIGRWVIEQSCLQLAQWLEQGIDLDLIAVNVSARQFKHPDFVSEVKNAILRSGIHPHQLELELTESILIDDIDYTLTLLHELRELGVRIAIDDFGTGYSSLNYLKQFPVDMLKIDKSFIQNLPSNRNDAQITRTIIAMAHNLGLAVIAEGVENNDQLDFLVRSRCEKIQGFLLSRPVHAEQLVDYLKTGAPEDITLADAEAEVNSTHPAHEE
ncbi:sensor domain-containing protein [Oceanobacter kriegii]|uniref:sensor domain-containing protein n=1 Tax=Oceanobacter kriegii TaxID=64972 RepID=UPI0004119242|nr:bifunctional diguanylate cyclase/phosphodiesterase [Oceanobacter kriegii]